MNDIIKFYVDIFGLKIEINSNDEIATQNLKNEMKNFIRNDCENVAVIIAQTVYQNIDDLPLTQRAHAMQSDPKLIISTQDRKLLLFSSKAKGWDTLRALVIRLICQNFSQNNFRFLHGTAITLNDGTGIAIVGDKGAGKTTLALSMIYKNGYQFVSDDVIMLGCHDGICYAYPLLGSVNLCLGDNQIDSIPQYVDIIEHHNLPLLRGKERFLITTKLFKNKCKLSRIFFPTIHQLSETYTRRELSVEQVTKLMQDFRYPMASIPFNIRCGITSEYFETLPVDAYLMLGGLNINKNLEVILQS